MGKEVDIYTTSQGDMWDGISYKVYGSDKFSKQLIKENIAYGNVIVFSSGINIVCPNISNMRESLPPWRK